MTKQLKSSRGISRILSNIEYEVFCKNNQQLENSQQLLIILENSEHQYDWFSCNVNLLILKFEHNYHTLRLTLS